jgi:hypothetical protein
MPMPQDDFAQQGPTLQITANGLESLDFGAWGELFHVEQFWVNGKALEIFVVSGFVLLRMHLRKIMPICALLQRMGIFGVERKNCFANRELISAKAEVDA